MGFLLRPSIQAADHPDAASLFTKVVQRAGKNASNSSVYLFDKRTTIDTFNSKGKITKQKIKLFLVTMTGGIPQEKLVGMEGEQLSAGELAKEEEKSKSWSRRFVKKNDKSTKRTFVPSDLTARFALSYLRQEQFQGRTTHVLAFEPKASAPKPKSFGDRIIKQLSGVLWIDDNESEIAQMEVKLGSKVSFWGGVLGALNRFEMKLNRVRSPEGVWYNQVADINLDARGLLKRLRMRIYEQSSNFRMAAE